MKTLKSLILFCSFYFIIGCTNTNTNNEQAATNNEPFDSILSKYQEDRFKLFPLEATSAGDLRYNYALPNNLTQHYRKEVLNFYTDYKNKLQTIDPSSLNKQHQLNYAILKWECERGIEADAFKLNLLPVNQFWSTHLTIGQLAGGTGVQPFKTVKDYRDWLLRLHAYVEWCDTAIACMKQGMKQGYLLPKALAVKVIPQFRELSKGRAEKHLFYEPILKMPADFSAEDKTHLQEEFKMLIDGQLIPVHKRMADFIEKEYLPVCRESSGISDIPHGRELYDYYIKLYTTTSMNADEIFELGQKEVERIGNEMQAIKEQLGFKGSMAEFFEQLRNKKELMPFNKPEQVIANFESIHARMQPNLKKLFNKTPKTPFEIRRTEAFREASASAEYNQGSMDGSRPGVFYVPIPDVKSYNILSDEDLFLHEAIPGHHYQISLQQENKDLAEFRKFLFYSAYGEGWALYTESLGKELGLYTDPYQYLGMLSAEMHRSIRLVVDVGMHVKGWTREQAIEYSKTHEAESEASIVAEIERYMAIPGQALSYKIGQLKIKELRAKAERELGSKFNIAEFHDQVLETGTIPLQLLEERINEWVAAKLVESR